MKKSTIVAAAFLAGALLAAQVVRAQAVQVCAPLDEHGKGHISDALFKGKMSTSSADLTGFC